MNLSFKNRIALYYMLATASITLAVFFIVYLGVQNTVFQELDDDLNYQALKHGKIINIVEDTLVFNNKSEWEEREHREVQVNPVFIQIVDKNGRIMDKSPNLKTGSLQFNSQIPINTSFDANLNDEIIRQIQTPLETQGKLKGYILTAISQEGSVEVLKALKKRLLLLFPMVLIVLFFITRFLAGRSILPLKTITQTTDSINRNNLNERILLPSNKDEIYALTSSINRLLERIKETIDREKQFTTDASHQLRTPLAVLKGTLEVLIRKPRTEEEYKRKIQASIGEIDRISSITDQLFLLARFDQSNQKLDLQALDLTIYLDHVLQRYRHQISEKELSINLTKPPVQLVYSDPYYLDLILENVLSNAIKYSPLKGKIEIVLSQEADTTICSINDQGIGIKKEDLQNIFNPFFRSNELDHKHIKGNGLGLSIVKKAGDLLGIAVNVSSQLDIGSTFYLTFPNSKV